MQRIANSRRPLIALCKVIPIDTGRGVLYALCSYILYLVYNCVVGLRPCLDLDRSASVSSAFAPRRERKHLAGLPYLVGQGGLG
jgi:hypothetical protein